MNLAQTDIRFRGENVRTQFRGFKAVLIEVPCRASKLDGYSPAHPGSTSVRIPFTSV